MPAERSTKRNAASAGYLSNNVEPCIICGKVVCRTSDIPRHMKKHDSDAKKIPCPWEGCGFSTLQKSNLDTHYRRHTQDRSFLCSDDPDCHFQTCDPASLLRHRKRIHGYIPRPSAGRKTGKPSKTPVRRGREASTDSSISIESLEFDKLVPSMDTSNSPLHRQESLLFSDSSSPYSYNYTWDGSPQSEVEFLAAESEIKQFKFQYLYQNQQEDPRQPKDFFPRVQLPNVEQVFPGYGTAGQLYGSYGLNFGLNQQPQQVSSPAACDFNSIFFDPSLKPAQPAVFTNATNTQVPSAFDLTGLDDLQTHASPDSIHSQASGHCRLTDLNGEIPDIDTSASSLNFNQYWWGFGFNPAFGTVPLGNGLENALIFHN